LGIKGAQSEKFIEMMQQDDDVSGPVTNYKTKVITMIYKEAGLRLADYLHGHERGIYFAEFYEKTKDFLCNKATEDDLNVKPVFSGRIIPVSRRRSTPCCRQNRRGLPFALHLKGLAFGCIVLALARCCAELFGRFLLSVASCGVLDLSHASALTTVPKFRSHFALIFSMAPQT
jgi:hypothetical protein